MVLSFVLRSGRGHSVWVVQRLFARYLAFGPAAFLSP
jgi:hypothetical protein